MALPAPLSGAVAARVEGPAFRLFSIIDKTARLNEKGPASARPEIALLANSRGNLRRAIPARS